MFRVVKITYLILITTKIFNFKESFEVYKKYQMNIHKDPEEDCDERTFKSKQLLAFEWMVLK